MSTAKAQESKSMTVLLRELKEARDEQLLSATEYDEARKSLLGLGQSPAKVQSQSDVVSEMKKERLMQRKSYLRTKEEQDALTSLAEDAAEEQARLALISLAEDEKLSAEDILALSYAFFGTDKTKLVMAAVYARTGFERVRTHNFYITRHLPESWWIQYGKILEHLPWPLLPILDPAIKEFTKLNNRLMDEGLRAWERAQDLEGGDSIAESGAAAVRRLPMSSFMRKDTATKKEFTGGESVHTNLEVAHVAEIVGGGSLAVLENEHGRYIDTGIIEQACSLLEQKILRLRSMVLNRLPVSKQKKPKKAKKTEDGAYVRQCYECHSPDHMRYECPFYLSKEATFQQQPGNVQQQQQQQQQQQHRQNPQQGN